MIELLYGPATSHLDIYPKECKSTFSPDTCTLMLIATLFIIARKWSQPSCPSTNESIKKM
jgi:hypothetical protein